MSEGLPRNGKKREVLRGIIYTRQKNRPVLHYLQIKLEILQGDFCH